MSMPSPGHHPRSPGGITAPLQIPSCNHFRLFQKVMGHVFSLLSPVTNTVDEASISGNLMYSISDHLAKFLIYPKQKHQKWLNEKTKYNKNYKKINRYKFEQDLEHIKWVEVLKLNDKNVDTSLENFIEIINSLLKKYALLKQITKK